MHGLVDHNIQHDVHALFVQGADERLEVVHSSEVGIEAVDVSGPVPTVGFQNRFIQLNIRATRP